MRMSRVVLACLLGGSLLVAPMASPASAGPLRDCGTQYLDAVEEEATPPSSDEVVREENGTLHIDADPALTYANQLVIDFFNHTWNYAACLNRESILFVFEGPGCISSTPGYQNLSSGQPEARYVEVILPYEARIHYGTLLADAQAIVDCI
jgi:hypothetical protein